MLQSLFTWNSITQYKPEYIIEPYFLPVNFQANSNHTITISYTTNVNAIILFGRYHRRLRRWFFRHGVSQSPNADSVITEQSYGNEIYISHQLRYSDTDEIAGHYVYMETIAPHFNYMLGDTCHGYYNHDHNFKHISVLVHRILEFKYQ